MTTTTPTPAIAANNGLVAKFANKYGVEPSRMLATLKATCFRLKGKRGEEPPQVTNEQMAALLIVAEQYGLNPFTKELYAFPDGSGGIMPMVSVDGWIRIINAQQAMDGVEFVESDSMVELEPGVAAPEWIECIIYRRDRSRPTRIRERFSECYRPAGTYSDGNAKPKGPWQTHPTRFLRHRALIQCARIAFGLAGIHTAEDHDDDDRVVVVQQEPATVAQSLGQGARQAQPARIEPHPAAAFNEPSQSQRQADPVPAQEEPAEARRGRRRGGGQETPPQAESERAQDDGGSPTTDSRDEYGFE